MSASSQIRIPGVSDPLPVSLGVPRKKPASGASGGTAQQSALPPELRQKVLERDDHICQGCGFRSLKYQNVHHVNQNPDDTALDNLRTVCIFCHQCFHLDAVSEMRSGVLIWLPEIGQAQLHTIVRAIYVARISQGPVADAARNALETLMRRRDEARSRIGTEDPFVLASVLQDYLTGRHYARKDAKLDGIRLMPLDRRIIRESDLEFNQFPQILAYWRSKDGAFSGKMPQSWAALYKDISQNISRAA